MTSNVPTMKFAEAKLKADLSNYLDWSAYMKTYLTYHKVWDITEKSPSEEIKSNDFNNIKAYLIIESQCEADIRRAQLQSCGMIAHKA